MIINKEDAIQASLLMVARSMASAATTAPKSRGFDDLDIKIAIGEEIKRIADKIEEIWRTKYSSGTFWFMGPDAEAVRKSLAIFLIGIKAKRPPLNLDCGACGFKTCEEYEKSVSKEETTALCVFKVLDLGIAAASALTVAGRNFIDNRLMWSVGVAAKELNYIQGDIVLGIPLSSTGANPFFDRYLRYFIMRAREEKKTLEQVMEDVGLKI